MALDLSTIDNRIRKLQRLKVLLTDEATRELIADPEMLELLRAAASKNGNVAGAAEPVTTTSKAEGYLPAEGSLRRVALEVARAATRKFDSRYVMEKMRLGGYKFESKSPLIAVNTALRSLSKRGLIHRVRVGTGRTPHIYEAVRKEDQKQ